MTERQENPQPRRAKLSLLALFALFSSAMGLSGIVGLLLELPGIRPFIPVFGYAYALYVWFILIVGVPLGGILGVISTIRIDRSHGRLKGVTLGVAAMAVSIICFVFLAIPTVRLISEILNDY